MKIFFEITIILNILTVLILFIGLFHKFENPKNKALYGYLIAAGMIPYLILLAAVIIIEIFKHNYFITYLILCLISPFVIGKMVTYETLKKYTIIQIICFIISLIGLIFSFFTI